MHYMSAKFGADRSDRFSFIARTHTRRHTDTQSQTPTISLPASVTVYSGLSKLKFQGGGNSIEHPGMTAEINIIYNAVA